MPVLRADRLALAMGRLARLAQLALARLARARSMLLRTVQRRDERQAMTDLLKDAREQWNGIMAMVRAQFAYADSAPIEKFALLAVINLLTAHQPHPDEDHSSGIKCLTCWDTWPCDVYQMIEGASHHGE